MCRLFVFEIGYHQTMDDERASDSNPILATWHQIGRSLSQADATAIVSSADVQSSLRTKHFKDASLIASEAARSGGAGRAQELARTIQAAGRSPESVTPDSLHRMWIGSEAVAIVAHDVLVNRGSLSAMTEGIIATEDMGMVARLLESSGLQAQAWFRQAKLNLAPFDLFSVLGLNLDFKAWVFRGWADRMFERDFDHRTWTFLPNQMLDEAEKLLRQALAVGSWPSRVEASLAHLAAHRWQVLAFEDKLDVPKVLDLARAVEEMGATDLPTRLAVAAELAPLGIRVGGPLVEQALSDDLVGATFEHGDQHAAFAMLMSLMALTADDPPASLAIVDRYRCIVDELQRDRRQIMIRLEAHTIYSGETRQAVMNRLKPRQAERMAEQTVGQARVGWMVCAAYIWASRGKDRRDLIERCAEVEPTFAAAHPDALRLLHGGLLSDLAHYKSQHGDQLGFISCSVGALQLFLDAGLADGVLETLLGLLSQAGKANGSEIRAIVDGLAPLLADLEATTGDQGVEHLQAIWRICLERFGGRFATDAALELMQLVSGHRYSMLSQTGCTYQVQQDEAAMDMLAELESELPAGVGTYASADELVQEVDLCIPITNISRSANEDGRNSRIINLQRRLDGYVHQQMFAHSAAVLPHSIQNIQPHIPDNTVVWLCALAPSPEHNCEAMWGAIITSERLVLTCQPFSEDLRAGLIIGGGRLCAGYEAYVAEVRYLIQQARSRSGETAELGLLLRGASEEIFGPAIDQIQQLAGHSKNHLVVIPTGPFHFFPFHLLGEIGSPLASRWLVTYAPGLHSVAASPIRSPHRDPIAAFAVEFGGEEEMPRLRTAVSEASAIAECYGSDATTGDRATRSAVVAALEAARRVHIASHGEHNYHAPVLQRLLLARDEDGSHDLRALDLIGRDLRGLELVTLSACETSLGRVDFAGNLRGLRATLIAQGTQAVVGTLWRVGDRVSSGFFESFHSSVADGAQVHDAFRMSQVAIRERYPRYRDWGAFSFTGSWR